MTNRLAGETSPYLLQHAENPVDWYPWGDAALELARAEDRPIFLSVGYAACHWCHVMERESFEDPTTAALMNREFVSIKVDREERPDVDSIYMDAVQAMTGSGGWPMSVFLTPEGRPFFAGTYYPPAPAHGMPSFTQVLTGIAEAWRDRKEEIVAQAGKVTEAIGRIASLGPSDEALSAEVTSRALATLRRTFDPKWGGFGGAPKFPQPAVLEVLLRAAARGDTEAAEMLETTLDRMAAGGIFDQLGGGFARYSTDAAWHVPHFEKMLYDNAQLAMIYTRAWLLTGEARHRSVAIRTLDYLLREMRHPEGGFWSSQDADSEGAEGKFFVWRWSELLDLVGEPVARAFGADPRGNWQGTNVLWRPGELSALAPQIGLTEDELESEIEDARRSLFEVRERRAHPATDDKVLTAWNAMAMRALAEAGRAFGSLEYVEAAVRCAEFVDSHLIDDRGRLLRSWRNGVGGVAAFADDHALLATAYLALYETTFELRWFERARELADDLLRLFADTERGGFFQTGSDADPLVVRPKELYDNAVPSGNSAGAEILLRLSLLTGRDEYEQAATGALSLITEAMAEAPGGFGTALCALDLYLGPSLEVAIVGDPSAVQTRALAREVNVARFLPNVVLAVAAPDDVRSREKVPLLADRLEVGGRPTAYVCERFACRLPVTTPEELARQLDLGSATAPL